MNFNKHRIESVRKIVKKEEKEDEEEKRKTEEAKRLTFDSILQKGAGLKKFLK